MTRPRGAVLVIAPPLPVGRERPAMKAVAVNVGANTSLPGFRGPIHPDGSFVYVPIPEREPADAPTYADLDLSIDLPADIRDRPVHHDPQFRGYCGAAEYTYGDDYGVKARPLSDLRAGDYAFFYATLTTTGEGHPEWVAPEWGAYLVGHFRLGMDAVTGEAYADLSPDVRVRFAENAHVRRESFDARVLLWGDPEESALYDRAVPLSASDAGATANRLVTDFSSDSGKGPWWRRPMRFDDEGTRELLSRRETGDFGDL